jgi:translation elongation factor EF-Tu-like GTPase
LRSKASITVEDLFSVGDDAVVLGRISRGVIRIGDKMQTEINGVSYVANVERIETLGSSRDIGYFTETVGLFFKEEHANNFVAGTVLTAASA